MSHDWAGILADGYSDQDILRAAEGLDSCVPCRVLAVATPGFVAECVGEGKAILIGVKAPLGMTSKMSELLGAIDWSPLEDEAMYSKALQAIREFARFLGLRASMSQSEAFQGRSMREESNDMSAIIQKAVNDQIQDLIRKNVLTVASGYNGGDVTATSQALSQGGVTPGGDVQAQDESDSDATMAPADEQYGEGSYLKDVSVLENEMEAVADSNSGLGLVRNDELSCAFWVLCHLVFSFGCGLLERQVLRSGSDAGGLWRRSKMGQRGSQDHGQGGCVGFNVLWWREEIVFEPSYSTGPVQYSPLCHEVGQEATPEEGYQDGKEEDCTGARGGSGVGRNSA
mgnify:CR=1 FL=1